MKRTRIAIDYGLCGDGVGVDPRPCGLCLRACDPAVFLLHETLGAREEDPFDPQAWRITALWSLILITAGQFAIGIPSRTDNANVEVVAVDESCGNDELA